MNKDKKNIGFTIISDCHILSRKLMSDNKEFNMAVRYDRKFLVEGIGLLKKALKLASQNESSYLLIPGDLTKDGELLSHLEVRDILKSWLDKDKDRRIFLIPGNHDINNYQAYDYKNLKPAQNISPKDFFDIYDFSYKKNVINFYKDSPYFKNYLKNINKKYKREEKYSYYGQGYLSYVARLDENLENENSISLIFLDSSIYSCDWEQNNKDGKNNVVGALDKNLMKWALDEIALAKKRKDMIFVIAHHALIPNFRNQKLVLGPFIIKNWNKAYDDVDKRIDGKLPIEALANEDVKFVFTGHLHENGTAKYKSPKDNEIFNIQTGSTVTYPLPIRQIYAYDDTDEFSGFSLSMKTQLIKSFDFINLKGEKVEVKNSIKYALENQLSLRDVLFNYVHSMAQNPIISDMNVKDFILDNLSSTLNIDLKDKGYMYQILNKFKGYFPFHINKFGDFDYRKENDDYFIETSAYKSKALIKLDDLEECLEILIKQFEEKIMIGDNIVYYYDKLMKKALSMPINRTKTHSLYDFSNYIYQYQDEDTIPSYVVEFLARLNNPEFSISDAIISYCEDEINEIFVFLTKNIKFKIDGSKDKFFDKLFTSEGLFLTSALKYIKKRSDNLYDLLTFIAKFILKKTNVKGVDIAKFLASYKRVRNIKENVGKRMLGRANLRSYIIDLVKSINQEVVDTYENEDLNERDNYFAYVEYEDKKE